MSALDFQSLPERVRDAALEAAKVARAAEVTRVIAMVAERLGVDAADLAAGLEVLRVNDYVLAAPHEATRTYLTVLRRIGGRKAIYVRGTTIRSALGHHLGGGALTDIELAKRLAA